MPKYITAKDIKVSCKFEGQENAETIPLRKGCVIDLDADRGVYTVVDPSNEYEKRVFLNESTLIGFKSLKAIVSVDAKNALATAKSGNNVQLEGKIIDLVNENNELKELVEELTKENERLTTTLANFTNSAANQGDGLNEDDEDEIPDYNAMTVAQLTEIADENGVDITGLKKAGIVEALLALHEEE